MTISGWGSMPWGAGPWGAGGASDLELLSALAVRENVVRLTFNVAPKFTKQLDPNDAANPERFTFAPQALPIGIDGEPARAIRAARVEVAKIPGALGSVLDVTTDRPMSPWPCRYLAAVNQLVSYSGALLAIGKTSVVFEAVYRQLRPQSVSSPTPSRDIANPQTYSAQLDTIPLAGNAQLLGVIPIDASGDYAFDQGLTQQKKRIIRRLLTPKGAFPALPNYGVGVPTYGKRLGVEGVRQQICADAEAQIAQEPDVAGVRVTAVSDPQKPEITIFRVKVRVASSGDSVQFELPFSPV